MLIDVDFISLFISVICGKYNIIDLNKVDITKLRLVIFILFVFLEHERVMAQSYTHTREGLDWGRYGPYDAEEKNYRIRKISINSFTTTSPS